MQFGNLDTHLNSQFCIQVGKRFVHKEYFWITNDRTSHSNTLSLSTGKSFWFTVKQFFQVKDSCCFFYFSINLIFRNFTKLQSECHVIVYCHMWIQSVVLEYHRDISVFWFHIVHNFSVNLQCTAGNIFQTCDHTKCCRFTTSGRSYKDDELFVFNVQIEIFYCVKSVRINFLNSF